jgi:type I restriction enzyme, S subunit
MRLKPYLEYKPSGVEWLGDVPQHWKVKRLKTSATCWVSNVDKVPAEDELPVRLCNYVDVYYHDYITPDMQLMETTATSDEIRRFGLREGDVVITKDSEEWNDIAVPALVKKTAPDFVCGYHLAIVRPPPKVLLGDYLLRAFQSCAINQQFQVAASGVTRYGLPKASIGDAWIPLPDPAEQRAIATFLDRETGRVDRLVGKKRELIERLKEKRTALISRTLTRGLPPAAARAGGLPENPPLKRSGLDWLGDIPEHWEVKRLKFTIKERLQYGANESAEIDDPDLPRYVRITDIDEAGRLRPETFRSLPVEIAKDYLLEDGDVLFARSGATSGKTFLYRSDWGTCAYAGYLIRARLDHRKIEPQFLRHFTDSSNYWQWLSSSLIQATIQNVSAEKYADLAIPLPPLPEQAAIAAYLDVETAKLDALAGKVKEAVERLREYRTALITAAVTGKIDVRKELHG